MFNWPAKNEWCQLARYYLAGLINLGFAYVLFAILVTLGLQVYFAQALGYILGVVFNYFTYSRLAFAGQNANKTGYIASYILNYLVSLGLLFLALKLVSSPYIAGLMTTIAASLINYFLLKRLVFRPRPQD